MSCGDNGGGMPGSSPRCDTARSPPGETVGAAVDDGAVVPRVVTRSVWSSGALHAVSKRTAAPRLVTRRRIEPSLRDVIVTRWLAWPSTRRPRALRPSARSVLERPAEEGATVGPAGLPRSRRWSRRAGSAERHDQRSELLGRRLAALHDNQDGQLWGHRVVA